MQTKNRPNYGKRLGALAAGLLLLLAAVYVSICLVIYNTLSQVTPGDEYNGAYTPAAYKTYNAWPDFDVTPYLMPDYDSVRFPSRQAELSLAGWYVAGDAGAPVVILTHGFGGCKCSPNVLTAAGMLHRNGFNVLLYDMREHGTSDIEDGRAAIGNEEYLDLLGAWDWLMAEKGFAPEQIGVFGVSLGAGTTLIAFGEEPRLTAVFVDSPFSDLSTIISEELARNNYPGIFVPGSIFMARVVAGDDLLAHSPQAAIRNAAGRPIYIVHGTGDDRIDVHHTRDLAALAAQTGANLTTWMPEGVAHVGAEFDFPADYERRLVGFFSEALNK